MCFLFEETRAVFSAVKGCNREGRMGNRRAGEDCDERGRRDERREREEDSQGGRTRVVWQEEGCKGGSDVCMSLSLKKGDGEWKSERRRERWTGQLGRNDCFSTFGILGDFVSLSGTERP